jgi:signal transduction histidine kinase
MMDSLQQARAQLAALLEAARTGAIIPFRLPGQLEAIDALLAQAQEQHTQSGQNAALPHDMDEFLKEQAFFVSHAVHELRTPMTSIRGYADMLNMPGMGELSETQRQLLDTIRVNARRMESLLTDVSDISKIKAGTLRMSPKMDMFKNVAMQVEKQTRPLADELHRKLEFDVAQGLPILNLDSELLVKALVKLVENALRYIEREDGEVVVRATSEGNKLIITIQDNGIGITEDDLRQLGTIYFRSENELVRSYKGSGLGIPVAYGIIKMLDGAVAVASTPGQGTTFTVTLTGMT